MRYTHPTTKIRTTSHFTARLERLQDVNGRGRIPARIQRLAGGNPGTHRNLKRGVSEMKIDVGPGYRVYFTRRQEMLIILLCGGDKSSQASDIELAYRLAQDLEL